LFDDVGQCLLLKASPEIFGVAHKYLILPEQISKQHQKKKKKKHLGNGVCKRILKKKHYFRLNTAGTNYTVKQAFEQNNLLFIAWK
jgi:hypothetical protein